MQRQRSLIAFFAGAIATVALTTAGTAIAGVSTATGPAATATCTRLWAVVNPDGSLARASCSGISSTHISLGGYAVSFPRNVRNCAYLATVGEAGHSGAAQAADISVQGFSKSADAVFAAVYSAPSTGVDEGFHLLVEC
jgi:hypothetical protein